MPHRLYKRFRAGCLVVLLVTCLPVVSLAAVPAPFHDIEIRLPGGGGEVFITDRVQVSHQHRYRFQLASWLKIEAVGLNGAAAAVQQDGGDYWIDLPGTDAVEIDFEMSGVIPVAGSAAMPASSLAVDSGDAVYLPGFAAWIPHDRGTALGYRLRLQIPAPWRAVVTGRLVTESEGDEDYRASFEQLQPGEAPSLFAGPYEVNELVDRDLRVRTYFHTGLKAHASHYLRAARDYIRDYEQEIGAYPYADFNVVSAVLPVGLGFPGLTYVDRRILPLPFMKTRSLAHEVLHNWWGNAVSVDYAGGNWAEGLTTYLADYGLEEDKNEAAARSMRVRWLRDYAALPDERDRPVREFISKQHQAAQVIGYNKTAFIFHMLRREIGDRSFQAGIQQFWRQHRFGKASWFDLQAAFEQSSARDLDWFFRQWLDQAGAPRLNLGSHRVEMMDDSYRISLEIEQPVPGYQFHLDVALTTESGVERRRLFIEERLTRLEWTSAERPVSILLDPQNDLFRRLQIEETPPILRDITLNPDSVVRIVGRQQAFVDNAQRLSQRLLETEPRYLSEGIEGDPGQPLLLIVAGEQQSATLQQLQLQVPADLPDLEHDAAVWTTRLADNKPVLIIAADSPEALASLLRPLPHYGGQSYVLFKAGRAQSRGLWPLSRGALYRNLTSSH